MIKPYRTKEFKEAFWQMYSDMGALYFETDFFKIPHHDMLSERGKQQGRNRAQRMTPDERRRFAYSGVYFNIKATLGVPEAVSRIVSVFGEAEAGKLIEGWESSSRKR